MDLLAATVRLNYPEVHLNNPVFKDLEWALLRQILEWDPGYKKSISTVKALGILLSENRFAEIEAVGTQEFLEEIIKRCFDHIEDTRLVDFYLFIFDYLMVDPIENNKLWREKEMLMFDFIRELNEDAEITKDQNDLIFTMIKDGIFQNTLFNNSTLNFENSLEEEYFYLSELYKVWNEGIMKRQEVQKMKLSEKRTVYSFKLGSGEIHTVELEFGQSFEFINRYDVNPEYGELSSSEEKRMFDNILKRREMPNDDDDDDEPIQMEEEDVEEDDEEEEQEEEQERQEQKQAYRELAKDWFGNVLKKAEEMEKKYKALAFKAEKRIVFEGNFLPCEVTKDGKVVANITDSNLGKKKQDQVENNYQRNAFDYYNMQQEGVNFVFTLNPLVGDERFVWRMDKNSMI